MHIALDARTVYGPVRRGTGKNLVDLYRTVARMRPDWHVVAYHRTTGPLTTALDEPNIEPRLIEMRGDRFHAWDRWRLPLAAWRDGADLLHCPANYCPTWMPVPTLVTIHDLIPLDMPQGKPPSEVRQFEQSVRTACKNASGIVCPSSYTEQRLVAEFGAKPQDITVNPWAADGSIRRVSDSDWPMVLQRYGVDRPFVLHFGGPAPRKNTARVLEAWALTGSAIRRGYQLLVVGLDGASLAEMETRLHNLGLGESVRLHGFANEQDLPTLLSAATMLAYPSLSEGFGLPLLDAWATDTPALCGDETSLPELADDAALLVDPADTHSISAGIVRMLRDRSIQHMLVKRGRRRLANYTWAATAARFIGAVENALGTTRTARRAA